jgi:hypothetical protein
LRRGLHSFAASRLRIAVRTDFRHLYGPDDSDRASPWPDSRGGCRCAICGELGKREKGDLWLEIAFLQ